MGMNYWIGIKCCLKIRITSEILPDEEICNTWGIFYKFI